MWIKVSERKPSKDGYVIGKSSEGDVGRIMYRERFDKGYWKANFKGKNLLNVEEWKDENKKHA